jgi:hypothetical protein
MNSCLKKLSVKLIQQNLIQQLNRNQKRKNLDYLIKKIKKMRKPSKYKKIIKEWENATPYEIWEGFRDNFIFAFIGATIVVFIATGLDLAVFMGYLTYYFFMGRILNRPKYVTDLGKLIVFPIPSTLGAFTGYKLSSYLIKLLS